MPALLLLFAVALALRVAWTLWSSGTGGAPGPESAPMDEVARHLAQGSGFTITSGARLEPTAEIPPVVPWVTSLLYRSTGQRTLAARLLQCAIGALVAVLVAALGRSLFGDPAGIWSGWLTAVHPLLVVAAGELAAGTTLCATLVLALLLSSEWVRTPRHARALGTGMAWGLAALTHPAALPGPLVVAMWAWRPLGLAVGGRARARQLGLLLLGVAVVVGPWSLRNLIETRSFSLVTRGNGGMLTGEAPGAPGMIVSVAIAVLAVWGLACTLRGSRRWFQALPLLIALSFAALSAGFAKRPDLRLPVEPLAAIYAAFGIEDARRRLRVRRSGLTVVPGRRGSARDDARDPEAE